MKRSARIEFWANCVLFAIVMAIVVALVVVFAAHQYSPHGAFASLVVFLLTCAFLYLVRMHDQALFEESNTKKLMCCAIRTPTKRIITLPAPARHHDVFRKMFALGYRNRNLEQFETGFMTSNWGFVSGDDALRIAVDAGQIPFTFYVDYAGGRSERQVNEGIAAALWKYRTASAFWIKGTIVCPLFLLSYLLASAPV